MGESIADRTNSADRILVHSLPRFDPIFTHTSNLGSAQEAHCQDPLIDKDGIFGTS